MVKLPKLGILVVDDFFLLSGFDRGVKVEYFRDKTTRKANRKYGFNRSNEFRNKMWGSSGHSM